MQALKLKGIRHADLAMTNMTFICDFHSNLRIIKFKTEISGPKIKQ